MSDMNEISLIELYDQILASIGHYSTKDGEIMLGMPGSKAVPVTVADKTLKMPTQLLLREPSEDTVFFHPLSEKLTRGESTVFRYIRQMALLRLNTAVSAVGHGLLTIQEHPEIQRSMPIDKQELFTGIVDTDKNSSENWARMSVHPIISEPTRVDKWPVTVFLKNNGQFLGQNFRRVGVVTFPLFELAASGERLKKGQGAEEKTLFRPKDYLMYQQVLSAIMGPIPKVENDEVYNSGYGGAIAPYLIAFLRSFKKIADRINYLVDTYANEFLAAGATSVAAARIPTDWNAYMDGEGLKTLESLARRVPALKGNIGSINGQDELGDDDEDAAPVVKAKPAPAPSRPAQAKEEPKAAAPVAKADEPFYPTPEHKRIAEEAIEQRRKYKEEQEHEAKLQKERDERRERLEREDREARGRRDEPKPWEGDDEPRDRNVAQGKVRFSIGGKRSRDDDDDYRGRRSSRDDRDYDRRDDRDYGRRDDRDYGRRDSRDYDRGYSRRDERDYRGYGRDDRDYGRRDERYDRYGRRDEGYGRRDDRGYGRRDNGLSRPRF